MVKQLFDRFACYMCLSFHIQYFHTMERWTHGAYGYDLEWRRAIGFIDINDIDSHILRVQNFCRPTKIQLILCPSSARTALSSARLIQKHMRHARSELRPRVRETVKLGTLTWSIASIIAWPPRLVPMSNRVRDSCARCSSDSDGRCVGFGYLRLEKRCFRM